MNKEYKVDKITNEFIWEIEDAEFDKYYEDLKTIMGYFEIPFIISNNAWGDDIGDMGGCMSVNVKTGEKAIFMGEGWFEYCNVLAIICMAHEMGHYYDLTFNFKNDYNQYHHGLGTLETEVRAWEFGVDFLREIGFKYWEELNILMKHCLGLYYKYRIFGYGRKPHRTFEQAQKDIMERVTL